MALGPRCCGSCSINAMYLCDPSRMLMRAGPWRFSPDMATRWSVSLPAITGTRLRPATYQSVVNSLEPGEHTFRVRLTNKSGATEYSQPVRVTVLLPALSLAFPNPFSQSTRFELRVDTPQHVRVDVYDVAGRQIRTLVDETIKGEGAWQTATWDGRNDRGEEVSSGVYFYRLEINSFRETRKMVLLR